VRITSITRLEVGGSAHSGAQAREASVNVTLSVMPLEYLTPAIEGRAVGVQLLLADRGRHRAPFGHEVEAERVVESGLQEMVHE
jgi:hypothetical protein